MLLGEDGGRDEQRDLATALNGFEGGADGDLGFPEADVAADEAIHGPGFLHVGFGVGDGFELVSRLGVSERTLELSLPSGVGRAGETGLGLALGMDAEQLGGEIDGRAFGGLAGFLPASGTDAAELGLGLAEPHVAADQMGFLKRNVKRDVVVELEGDDFPDALRGVEFGEAAVKGDPVLEVDHEVAFDEFGEIKQLVDLGALGGGANDPGGAAGALPTEDLGLGDEHETGGAGTEFGPVERGAGGAEGDFEALVERAAEKDRFEDFERRILGDDLADALLFALLGGDDGDGVAGLAPSGDLAEEAAAGVDLDLQALLRDEGVVGVGAVMGEALGIPSEFSCGRGEQRGGLVKIAQGEVGGATGGERREAVEALAGERAERRLEQGGLDEDEVGGGREVVGEAGLGRSELDARGGGEGDLRDGLAGTLRDGVEGPDLFKFVAEEIETVGLRRGDGVDVDDAAANRVVAGRFADGFGIVVEGAELF